MSNGHLLITGASTGIGRATADGLAENFDRITLVGRSSERHAAVLDGLRRTGTVATLVECELGSLASVAAAAEAVDGTIDVLIANAGVGGRRGVTHDGFELHFGVNHVAHHLLVTELAGRITDRVVIVSSNAHYDSDGLDFDRVHGRTSSLTGFREYRDSKLANVLDGMELARRFPFATHVVHPGVTATAIWRRIPWPLRPLFTRRMQDPDQGADTPVWAATASNLESGGYYARRTRRSPSDLASDEEAARELWERTEAWVSPFRRRR